MLLPFQDQTVGRRIELRKKKIEFLIISRLVLNIEILFTILNNWDPKFLNRIENPPISSCDVP